MEHDESLERLKRAAEAEMRRSAPPLSKKQKLEAACQQDREQRYSYAAPDALVQGAPCFLATCNFKREKSATLELQDILRRVLPGVKLQLVRVDCNGLVVVMASRPAPDQPAQQPSAVQDDQQQQQQQPSAVHEQQAPPTSAAQEQQQQQPPPPSEPQQQQQQEQHQPHAVLQPTAVVEDILRRIEAGSLPRTKFIQRIIPAETTCLLTAAALRPALQLAVSRFIQNNSSSSSSSGSGGPVTYAVAFKARGSNSTSGKKQAGANVAAGSGAAGEAAADVEQPSVVHRGLAIELAAAVVQECCRDLGGARADLSDPQVAIVLEVVPVAGQQLVCSVAALPGAMMIAKPRLVIKPSGA